MTACNIGDMQIARLQAVDRSMVLLQMVQTLGLNVDIAREATGQASGLVGPKCRATVLLLIHQRVDYVSQRVHIHRSAMLADVSHIVSTVHDHVGRSHVEVDHTANWSRRLIFELL